MTHLQQAITSLKQDYVSLGMHGYGQSSGVWAREFNSRMTLIEAEMRIEIEADLRTKIAADIRGAKRTGMTRTEAYGWHNNAIERAATIAEGNQ